MASIGFATLEIIPSLRGVTEAIEKQVAGKVVNVTIEPKVDQRASDKAGKQAKETAEKHTKEVRVEPKVDQKAAEDAGKKAGDAVSKGIDQANVGNTITEALQGVGQEVGRGVGTGIADAIPQGMDGAAGRIADGLRATLPEIGAVAGVALGTAIGEKLREGIDNNFDDAVARGSAKFDALIDKIRNARVKAPEPEISADSSSGGVGTSVVDSITNSVVGDRLDRAGAAIMNGLKAAIAKVAPAIGIGAVIGSEIAEGVKNKMDRVGGVVSDAVRKGVGKVNTATDVGIFIGDKIAGGLRKASGKMSDAAGFITNTVGNLKSGIGDVKAALGGDDSWAAPGLDVLNGALEKATPLINGLNTASTIAAGAADLMSIATKAAAGAQWLLNTALDANPIGLVVLAIAALVAGLVWFFTQTEIGRKIWEGFTEYLKIAWEAIKTAFGIAWDFISSIWNKMVEGAQIVWDGVKEKFTNIVNFVKELPGKITNFAKGMWDGLKGGLVNVLNWIIDKWNSFADKLSVTIGDDRYGLPHIPNIGGYATGGYTGSGSTDKVAGVVHGGEYVIKASSTAGIQNAYPGLLDYLNNNGALPGFKAGGSVNAGVVISSAEQTSMWDAVRSKFPSAVLTSGTRTEMTEGHPDFHNAGRAIDLGGPNMGGMASWIASNFPGSLELIHSPFGHNIKNGKNVGDGMSFYGAGLMADHRNHIHWALGRMAGQVSDSNESADSSSSPESKSGNITAATPTPTPSMTPSSSPAEPATAASESMKMSMPGSISGLSTWGLSDLGVTTQVSPDSPERTFEIGNAASAAVSGQVSSALGMFGVNDAPGWLKGASQLISGISVSAKGGDGAASPVAPLSAASSVVPQATSALTGVVTGGGAQQPTTQVNYNIRTAETEDAFIVANRREKERAASNLARF